MTTNPPKDNSGIAFALIEERLGNIRDDIREIRQDNKDQFAQFAFVYATKQEVGYLRDEIKGYRRILYGVGAFFGACVGGFLITQILLSLFYK